MTDSTHRFVASNDSCSRTSRTNMCIFNRAHGLLGILSPIEICAAATFVLSVLKLLTAPMPMLPHACYVAYTLYLVADGYVWDWASVGCDMF